MVSKRGIPICGAIVLLFFFVFTTASTAADKVDKTACVKNNAGVVLEVGQDLSGFSDPFPLGQTIKVYDNRRLFLLCSSMFGEYSRCAGDDGKKDYYLQPGQTIEVTGTIFAVYTTITDNTCK
ncbi:MAG: hypothetical protein KBB65_10190 [Syntrophorhabdaceae bacterium]|nr:hypothetical protein [Syntrophorhabdaceae bacterium]